MMAVKFVKLMYIKSTRRLYKNVLAQSNIEMKQTVSADIRSKSIPAQIIT